MKRYKINFKEISFYLFLFFIMIYYAFRKATMDYTVLEFTLYLSIPFLIFKIFMEKYTLKELMVILALVILGIISYVIVHDTSILIAFCIVIGMKSIDYISALKIVFKIRLFTTIFLVIGAMSNLIVNKVVVRNTNYDIMRFSMGYTHPNTFGIYCFVLISLWFIIEENEKWKWKVALSGIIAFFQYHYTNSRTSLAIIILYLCMVCAVNTFIQKNIL